MGSPLGYSRQMGPTALLSLCTWLRLYQAPLEGPPEGQPELGLGPPWFRRRIQDEAHEPERQPHPRWSRWRCVTVPGIVAGIVGRGMEQEWATESAVGMSCKEE